MITIWGTSTCVWCKRAIKLCEDYKLSYAYRLIDNQEKLAELQESLQEVAPGSYNSSTNILEWKIYWGLCRTSPRNRKYKELW